MKPKNIMMNILRLIISNYTVEDDMEY